MGRWDVRATVRRRAGRDARLMTSHRPSFRLATPSFLLALALVSGSAAPAIARNGSDGGGAFGGTERRDAPRAQSRRGRADRHPRVVAAGRAGPPRAVARRASGRRPTSDHRCPRREGRGRPEGDRRLDRGRGGDRRRVVPRSQPRLDPGLGVSRSISFFACTSKAYPGDRVYRWGCAGSNNVYLFGHAHSVFKPLHDAYVTGRLRKGMVLYYAGNDGVVHTLHGALVEGHDAGQGRLGVRRPVGPEPDAPDLRRGEEPVPARRPPRPDGLTATGPAAPGSAGR